MRGRYAAALLHLSEHFYREVMNAVCRMLCHYQWPIICRLTVTNRLKHNRSLRVPQHSHLLFSWSKRILVRHLTKLVSFSSPERSSATAVSGVCLLALITIIKFCESTDAGLGLRLPVRVSQNTRNLFSGICRWKYLLCQDS